MLTNEGISVNYKWREKTETGRLGSIRRGGLRPFSGLVGDAARTSAGGPGAATPGRPEAQLWLHEHVSVPKHAPPGAQGGSGRPENAWSGLRPLGYSGRVAAHPRL